MTKTGPLLHAKRAAAVSSPATIPAPRGGAPARNLGVLAHIDAGKTTLTEQILYLAGELRRPGAVDFGSTVTDWLPEERRRGITVTAAASSCRWRGAPLTLVDTPGHVDFTLEVERSLRVLDGAVLLLSGPDGVEAQTETVWHQVERRALPAVGFVNKLDRPGVDLDAVARGVRDRLGLAPAWMTVVLDVGPGHATLGDPVHLRVARWTWPPERHASARVDRTPPTPAEDKALGAAREELLELVAVADDAFAERYLAGHAFTAAEILRGLRRLVRARGCLPLWVGAAAHGVGVPGLLDGVEDLLPRSSDRTPPRCFDIATGVEVPGGLRAASGEAVALVFKTERRWGAGRLAWVRVFAGALRPGDALRRLPGGEPVTVASTVRIVGGAAEPVDELGRGAIGGVLVAEGQDPPRTGETLAAHGIPWALEPITPPAPVLAVALEAPDLAADEAMRRILRELAADDPSLAVHVDPHTGQTLLQGMGELHLELAVRSLADALQGEVRTGTPRARAGLVVGRGASAEAQSPAGSQPRGRAEVRVRLDPLPSDRGVDVRFETGAAVRADWRLACEAGIEAALQRPDGDVLGLTVRVERLAARRGEPPPVHFRNAALAAVARALAAAALRRAEPWVSLELVVPPGAVGAVTGDLARRRGKVLGTEARGLQLVLRAEAPLQELIGYATPFRSLTSGRGAFSMEPAGYRPAASVATRLSNR